MTKLGDMFHIPVADRLNKRRPCVQKTIGRSGTLFCHCLLILVRVDVCVSSVCVLAVGCWRLAAGRPRPIMAVLLLPAVLTATIATTGAAEWPCYVQTQFAHSQIQVLTNVTYGSAFNKLTKQQQTLTLDVYFPPQPATTAPLRPSVVLIHGGSFETGNSQSDDEPAFAYQFAMRGYAVVSINYRLEGTGTGEPGSSLLTPEPAITAAQDARAAVRFVRANAQQYHLDPDRIVVGGDSAGAITSLWLGYVQQHDPPGGSTNDPGYSSNVSCVVAVSGELGDRAFCQSVNPISHEPHNCAVNGTWDYTAQIGARAPQPALALVHGTHDLTVPYIYALKEIQRAQEVGGIPHTLVTVPGGGHVPFEQLFSSKVWMDQLFGFVANSLEPPCGH
jgi:acetyl esterase/lipase